MDDELPKLLIAASMHWTTLSRGVPQGSILGPLLYSIYTNELAEMTTDDCCNDETHRDRTRLFGKTCERCGLIVTYADDATFLVLNKNRVMNQLKLNTSLAKLEIFLSMNELAINVSKTAIVECMIKQKRGKTPGEPPHLIVENQSKPGEMLRIRDSECLRILGTNIQPNISWQKHLEGGKKAVLPGIRRQLGQLKMMGRQLPRASRKILAEGLLMSKFIYLITQWGGATENYIGAAQRLQNKMARWVTDARAKTRISTLLEDTGWLSIRELTVYHSLLQCWKILRLQKPENMVEHLTLDENNFITTPEPRIQFTLAGFRWRVTRDWNSLPADIRTQRSLPIFKKAVKSWITLKRQQEPD